MTLHLNQRNGFPCRCEDCERERRAMTPPDPAASAPERAAQTLRQMAAGLNLLDVDLPECTRKTCANRAHLKAACLVGADALALLAQRTEERDAYRRDWQAELDGNEALRVKHGARDNETMFAFIERIVTEHQQRTEEIATLVEQRDKLAQVAAFNKQEAETHHARAEKAEEEIARLRTALQELEAHADYGLNPGGQRTKPPMFVPSVSRRVKEICEKALAACQAQEEKEK